MYSRKGSLTSRDVSDRGRLRTFANELSSTTMYQPILDQLRQVPGFVRKEHTIIDDLIGEKFVSIIVFETKEHFESYINEESAASLWDYLMIMADQAGIDVVISDQEIDG